MVDSKKHFYVNGEQMKNSILKIILIVISFTGLVLTIVPSVLVFVQEISMETHKQLMLPGMILWFFSAPFWMKEQEL